MSPKTAYCFDLDGTVTSAEILPLIAQKAGIFEEMQVLTEATLKVILPFEKSFRLRCKLLADVPISVVHDVVRAVPVDPEIHAFITAHSSQCFILTGNLDVWMKPLFEALGCKAHSSRAESQGDRLGALTSVLHKGDAITAIRKDFDRVIAIGEGFNDISMLECADIGIAYGGVHDPMPDVIDVAQYVVTNGRGLCRLLSTL